MPRLAGQAAADRAIDGSTTRANSQKATTPQPIAQPTEPLGMNRSFRPRPVCESMNENSMCRPMNAKVRPPSQLWRASHQFGFRRVPVLREEKNRPHTSAATASTAATMPVDRVRYHDQELMECMMTVPPLRPTSREGESSVRACRRVGRGHDLVLADQHELGRVTQRDEAVLAGHTAHPAR